MMDDQRRIRVSKFLSKHLRHQPERLGLTLQAGGWVAIDDFLTACARQRFPIDHSELTEIVATSDKQRFAFDPTGLLIRANQGHSVDVDLQLEALAPPALLYHGTGTGTVDAILRTGLVRMARHHVHLSADVATALKVGARHGRPVVFQVDAAALQRDGFTFYRSANGVWLIDAVPPAYLRLADIGAIGHTGGTASEQVPPAKDGPAA